MNKKKIFVSQGTLNLGRNRAKRILEAELDYGVNCEHESYCYKLKGLPKAHCSEDYMKVCGQIKTYYDRFGEVLNRMGIGS